MKRLTTRLRILYIMPVFKQPDQGSVDLWITESTLYQATAGDRLPTIPQLRLLLRESIHEHIVHDIFSKSGLDKGPIIKDYAEDGKYLVVTIANVSGDTYIDNTTGNRITAIIRTHMS